MEDIKQSNPSGAECFWVHGGETAHIVIDSEGQPVLDASGSLEMQVEIPSALEDFPLSISLSIDDVTGLPKTSLALEEEKMAALIPLLIRTLRMSSADGSEEEEAKHLLEDVATGEPAAVNCISVMWAATTNFFHWFQGEGGGAQDLSESPDHVKSLIDTALRLLEEWKSARAAGGVAEAAPQIRSVSEYNILTPQEFDVLGCAASDGRTGGRWWNNLQTLERVHQNGRDTHFVRIGLTAEEKAGGLGMDALERLTNAQDADCMFALLYVSGVLIPENGVPGGYAGGWISLDDVMAKIGWSPRTTAKREQARACVWQYLLFGARAQVVGQRSSTYKDPDGKEIPTRIESPLWNFLSQEKPVQPALFPEQDVPLRVEIIISKQWENLMTNPRTAQYLPAAELLGAIPGSKPGGAWARTIGLSLANFWRRNPRETLAGSRRPTRRELLTRFLPKKSPPEEVLNGENPQRALEYWHGALQELTQRGFLAARGEAARTLADMKTDLPRYDWQKGWLDGEADLMPGPKMSDHVARCASSLPPIKPKSLDAPRRRGRPRKAA